MGVGVVILAVTHVARNDTRASARPVEVPVEAGAMARFLREPPVPPPAYPALTDTVRGGDADGLAAASYDVYPTPPDERQMSPREEAYGRALRAGPRGGDPVPGGTSTSSPSAQWGVGDPGGDLAGYTPDPYAGLQDAISAVTNGMAAYGTPAGDRPAGAPGPARTGDRYREFLAAAAESREPTYIASRLEEPISPYQIMAGTLLPAMLVTGINSDLPGQILAQVTRNVYDSQQRFLLIPRGTNVIGRYDDQIALGQSRVLIAWTRLILPDGRSLSLPGLPTQDLRGATGLRDKVDNHYRRLYGQATLLSIIGAGAQLSQPQQGSVFSPPSAGQVAAGALGQELSRVSMETIRRNMDVRPTLEVRPGTPFYIFLERDLVFDGAYTDAG